MNGYRRPQQTFAGVPLHGASDADLARLHRAARAAARPGRAIETIRIGLRREFPLGGTVPDLENWINGPATGEGE